MNGGRGAEARASVGFLLCFMASGGLAFLYWRGGQPQLEGALLAVALGGLCFGFVIWANQLLESGPFVEERHELVPTEAQREQVEEDFERGGEIERRGFLLKSLGLALAGLGVAAVFPIRSLGPDPGRSLQTTPWRRGLRVVTDDDVPILADEVPFGGLVTVFPEGHPGSADGQAVLVRVEPGLIVPRPGREDWAPRGLLAYSKVCTHAGCPVGLYEADEHQLLCPCHQSTFDVLDGARPVFGPAAVSLPQLPLAIDTAGFLRARGDFSGPVGPAWWTHG